jgi:Flp pilus assembly protein TadG
MRRRPGARLAVTGERGAVLVFFALFAPVAVLFLSFVIDIGNWFDHARHLQLQADAGALAAAQAFQPCNDSAIYSAAGQYSGASSVKTPTGGSATAGSPLYNPQIGGTTQANIHELVNSPTYYEQPSPVDSSVNTTNPCASEMVDVKLTETDLPWYFRLLSVPYINAHARVEILQETSARGMEPLAVAQTAPVAAKAYFVNEDKSNEVLASVGLEQTSTNAQGQGVWTDAKGIPVPVTINKTNLATAHIGVVIALSGNAGHTKCGETYVQCFDEQTGPLLHIAGYSNEGKGTLKAPLAHRVTLSPVTCTDGYFSSATGSCTFTISAKIDYGSTNMHGVTVTPKVKGAKEKEALAFNSSTGLWTGSAALSSASGSNEVSLVVQCNPKAKESACAAESKSTEATIADVHRIYAASWEKNSGTIAGAWIGESEGSPLDANSFEVCEAADENHCTHKLTVTLDVGGSLAVAAGYSDPLRHLRWEGEQGVRAGCPPPALPSGSQYRETLEQGCQGTYAINTSDPECTANASPYQCLTVGLPGKDVGPTVEGIDKRIESTPGTRFYCPNSWQNTNKNGVPIIPSDDSRIVQVFVIPYGTVDAEGRSTLGREEVPIQNFAAFYVTGFPGDTCKSDPSTGNAEIVGHFIEYVNPLGVGGEGKCVASSIGECVAVLTR